MSHRFWSSPGDRMSKKAGKYRYCPIMLATALAIITSSKADVPIRNYPLSADPPQLLITEDTICQDSEGNLTSCPQHHG